MLKKIKKSNFSIKNDFLTSVTITHNAFVCSPSKSGKDFEKICKTANLPSLLADKTKKIPTYKSLKKIQLLNNTQQSECKINALAGKNLDRKTQDIFSLVTGKRKDKEYEIAANIHNSNKKEEICNAEKPERKTGIFHRASKVNSKPESTYRNLKLKILLVEDDTLAQSANRNLIENVLGHHLYIANTGAEALKLAITNEYDLILMDLGLPDTTGFEVAKQIRTSGGKNAQIPIITLTAHGTPELNAESLFSGLNDFIVKPLDLEKIQRVLDKWIYRNFGMPPAEKFVKKQAVKENKGLQKDKAIKMFSEMIPEQIREITKAIEQNDFPKLEQLAHKIMGTACYCGTLFLKETAKNLKIAAHTKNEEQVFPLARKLIKEMDEILTSSKN